tara:strand:+ start:1101 stop:1295 length:195 start_codon:yes stop_codon:yes gene_type:complete
MYLETHLLPTKRDDWIINLHLADGTKIEAKLVRGYTEAVAATKKWSAELHGCKYTVGGMSLGSE